MTNFIYIYITNRTKAEAKKIALYLLKRKLIACANILGPIESMYHWKGKIADEKEFVLIAKTINKNYNKVVRETEKIHSYTVPCIVKIPVSSNKKYFDWIIGELN
ncbi:MAG: hypothetical protein A3B23_02005 [Candidatus Colwellbacteria bacterium RIFCSPLOWO2_01_FULL_48_10]|uniref:Cation tolerance protein CutA n=2 Tax=Bacteria candidate phyla TaxID=1783234 RepID=A0A1F5P1H0_9BACT|nr:MAG: hypothetical protein A2846_04375 [Candidatus Doudnabacteria bacterium RIFCSPHIGHO2_01_FULL_49_9]OGY59112.1 MAG: hypothetical protein A3B23_02005 [Candidatus Colwellbacteria bacterium RIFCSPLOWO2_01_FULL_48_10]